MGITYRQIITRVINQVSALKPTADTRLSENEALFQINLAAAAAYTEKLKANYREYGVIMRDYTDPSLYRDVELSIGPDNKAELPVSVLTLPYDYGIRTLYLLAGSDRQTRMVDVVSRNEAALSQRTYFGSRKPMAVRTGQRLEFFNHDSLSHAVAEVLTLDMPTTNGEPDVDSDYPIPADLLENIVLRATQFLSVAKSQRPDYTADAKDSA